MNDPMKTHSAFSWCELRTPDVAKAKAFYQDVVGWEIEEMEMPGGTYTVLKAGGQPVGGITNMGSENGAGWVSYITVDDVDARIGKAEAGGGKALMPPMDVPGVGRMAMIADPAGATVSLIKYEEKS